MAEGSQAKLIKLESQVGGFRQDAGYRIERVGNIIVVDGLMFLENQENEGEEKVGRGCGLKKPKVFAVLCFAAVLCCRKEAPGILVMKVTA